MTKATLTLLACLLAGGASATESRKPEIRKPTPTAPIATSVTVPVTSAVTYLSGVVPPLVNKDAPPDSVAAFGDTKTQTINVLTRIKAGLEAAGLGFGDVVKMQVFLVGDPAQGGRMDFKGFSEGYAQFFNTAEQPNVPARSTMQVAGLVNPGWLVEIEVTAAK